MTRHGHGWGSHGHGPGFKPPWWPENEPFPPAGGWHRGRRRFVGRVIVMIFFLFALLTLVSTFVSILPDAFGEGASRGTRWMALLFGLLVLFLFWVFAMRLVRRLARPIGEVMEAADRVASGDYAVRIREHGWWETRRLARSFNAMAERLGSNEEKRRNLLADLAHELRTPLSVIQGNVEGMLDGLYPVDRDRLEPLLDETRVLARLLDDLETLSRAESGVLRLHREATDAAELVADAVGAFTAEADAAGVELVHRAELDIPQLEVDPVRISQVLANLVSNAIQHSDRGGTVTVLAELGDDRVAFSVKDDGPGIDPEILPHVFDRFVKAADSGGAGLGLAIAKSLVEAHGGEIVAQSGPGKGTMMRFVLPLPPDDRSRP